MTLSIFSLSNPKIKWVKNLHKNSTRKESGLFIVEGFKEVSFALEASHQPHSLFINSEIFESKLPTLSGVPTYKLTKECYEKISYRSSTEGVLAVFHSSQKGLGDLKLNTNPLLLIVESVEKPGNLGAILRTADGAGFDAVIVCDPKVDIFNPNVIRASLGTVFTKQIVVASSEETYEYLQERNISAYGAILSPKSKKYESQNYNSPTAFVLGTEHDGLSQFWQQRCIPIQIPMQGKNDSLNVSVAAAVLAYEAVRQRNSLDSE